jgi:hypothetical protein
VYEKIFQAKRFQVVVRIKFEKCVCQTGIRFSASFVHIPTVGTLCTINFWTICTVRKRIIFECYSFLAFRNLGRIRPRFFWPSCLASFLCLWKPNLISDSVFSDCSYTPSPFTGISCQLSTRPNCQRTYDSQRHAP